MIVETIPDQQISTLKTIKLRDRNYRNFKGNWIKLSYHQTWDQQSRWVSPSWFMPWVWGQKRCQKLPKTGRPSLKNRWLNTAIEDHRLCKLMAMQYENIQDPTELWKKKRFNLQAPPVYERKVTNLFFSIIIFSIIIFFSIILSVP